MRKQNLARLVEDMPDDELRDTRRDLAVGLSLLRPGSAMYGPAHAYLGLIDAELAQRHGAGRQRQPPRAGGAPAASRPGHPGT